MSLREQALVELLDRHDQIICECARGSLSFAQFLERYNSFYMTFALDVHSSNAEEQQLIRQYEARIAIHRDVWESILLRLSADEDAVKPAYRSAGFIGSAEALGRLQVLAVRHQLCS
jgi:hypothetical protein